MLLREYIRFIILESKQNLINIGIPPVISSIFMQKFGKNAFVVGRWLKEYNDRGRPGSAPNKNWFMDSVGTSGWSYNNLGISVDLYNAAEQGEEAYIKAAEEHGISPLGGGMLETSEIHLEEIKYELKQHIQRELLDDFFFKVNTIIQDISRGKLKDLSPYKKLSFQEAKDRYDNTRLFNDITPIKTYENGWKWIDAGSRCQLVGNLMKNCGSTGVMSTDPDRTMLTLFDENNKPHVVVTYSPNENRISGDQGKASTAVKEEYHEYVIDLADTLNSTFDIQRTKSNLLGLKYRFKDSLKKLVKLKSEGTYEKYYKLFLDDGSIWYTDSHIIISAEDFKKAKEAYKELRKRKRNKDPRFIAQGYRLNSPKSIYAKIFNHNNRDAIKSEYGIEFENFYQFMKRIGQEKDSE